MQVALAVFVSFCAWLFSPVFTSRMRILDLSDVGMWGGVGESALPDAWRGLFYFTGNLQPDGSPSPLLGMDTTMCSFNPSRRLLSCPVASMLWATRDDSAPIARRLAAARFRYDFAFDEKFESARLSASIFGFDVLGRIGLVWDIAKASGDGSTLKRCSWAVATVGERGPTPLERVRRSKRGSRSCYRLRRVAHAGRVSGGVLKQLKRAWGASVSRFA
jgi:hypothetical protein